MTFRLAESDAEFRSELRGFFGTEVPEEIRNTVRDRRELSREQVVESQQILNAAGLAVPNWPQQWGGRDWTPLQQHIWHEELQLACVPIPYGLNTTMAGPVIAEFGSTMLKERFLAVTANLDIWWVQGFSEPDAGSDLAALRTTAVIDGDHYVVNGQKTWSTYAQYGDWIFMLVRTDPHAPKKQAGISFLLIDMATPGITVRPIELIDGSREVNEMFFDDVRVPVENLVGEENRGWSYAKFLLGNERVGAAPVGTTKRLLLTAKEIARTAGPGKTSMLNRGGYADRIADLENDLLALELTVLRVVANSKDGAPHPASSLLKLRGTELQQEVTELIADLAGPNLVGSGADDRSGLSDWEKVAGPGYLNYRKASIYGGSNEIQRLVIADGILGLKG
jgi:alkylation response protein AidB-like acyl-CoA dehydrogenase